MKKLGLLFLCCLLWSVYFIQKAQAQQRHHLDHQDFALMQPEQQLEFIKRVQKIILHQELLVTQARIVYGKNPNNKQVYKELNRQEKLLRQLKTLWHQITIPKAHAALLWFDPGRVTDRAMLSDGGSNSDTGAGTNQVPPTTTQPPAPTTSPQPQPPTGPGQQTSNPSTTTPDSSSIGRSGIDLTERGQRALASSIGSPLNPQVDQFYQDYYQNIPEQLRCSYGGWPGLKFVGENSKGQKRVFCSSPQGLANSSRLEEVIAFAQTLNEEGLEIDIDNINSQWGEQIYQHYQQNSTGCASQVSQEDINLYNETKGTNFTAQQLEQRALILSCNPEIYGELPDGGNCVFTMANHQGELTEESINRHGASDWGNHHALVCWQRAAANPESASSVAAKIIEQGPNSAFMRMTQEIYNLCVCNYNSDNVLDWSGDASLWQRSENQTMNAQDQLHNIVRSLSTDCMALMDFSRRILREFENQYQALSCDNKPLMQYNEQVVSMATISQDIRQGYEARLRQRLETRAEQQNPCSGIEDLDELQSCIYELPDNMFQNSNNQSFLSIWSANMRAHRDYISESQQNDRCPIDLNLDEVDFCQPQSCDEYTVNNEGSIVCHEDGHHFDFTECGCIAPDTPASTPPTNDCEPSTDQEHVLSIEGDDVTCEEGYDYDPQTCTCEPEDTSASCEASADQEHVLSIEGDDVTCEEGYDYDPQTCTCEPENNEPADQDPQEQVCQLPSENDEGVLSVNEDTREVSCRSGYQYNEDDCRCEAEPEEQEPPSDQELCEQQRQGIWDSSEELCKCPEGQEFVGNICTPVWQQQRAPQIPPPQMPPTPKAPQQILRGIR